MKSITIYEATDKSRHDTQEAAEARDALCLLVAEVMRPLSIREQEGCSFVNGSGYFQHFPETVMSVKRALISATRPYLSRWMNEQETIHKKDLMNAHPSWFGRMLDGAHRPLEEAWGRLGCITANGREYGQPYYAAHPGECKDVCLNP